MELSSYAIESDIEATSWWFVARRKLFTKMIATLKLPPEARILEVGTSTGTNLRLLRDLGFKEVIGIDKSEEAIRFCAQKRLGIVQQGDICQLPFADGQFNLILATDILEHIEDDLTALAELKRVLAADGWAIITVPAFPILWGLQDEVSHHKRRYRMKQLQQQLETAGFVCVKSFYFNYLLFLPIWLARQLIRVLKIRLKSENQVNTPWLNRILTWIFTIDVMSAPVIKPPFGVSIFTVVQKATG